MNQMYNYNKLLQNTILRNANMNNPPSHTPSQSIEPKAQLTSASKTGPSSEQKKNSSDNPEKTTNLNQKSSQEQNEALKN